MRRSVFYLLFSLLLSLPLPGAIYGQDTQPPPPKQEQATATPEYDRHHSRPKPCSVRTLRGSYGYLMKGTNLNWLQLPAGPMAVIGVANYDGAGNVTTTATSLVNGLLVPINQTGTYTVNEDCTGVVNFPLGLYPIVITADGREIHGVQAYPSGVVPPAGAGWVIEGLAKKIAPAPRDDSWREWYRAEHFTCNPRNVAGEYAVKASGTILKAPPLPAGPALGLSKIVLDENGHSTVQGTFNFNGTIIPVTDTATGTDLKPDCTSTAQQTANGALQKTVFVNGGTEFFFLQLPPAGAPNLPGVGAVFFGEGKRIREPERRSFRW